MKRYTASQLSEAIKESGDDFLLLDVREAWEVAICRIQDSVHMPMGEITGRLDELRTNKEVVVICHHGARSFQVASYLLGMGIPKVANLDGGIDAWARGVEPDVATY